MEVPFGNHSLVHNDSAILSSYGEQQQKPSLKLDSRVKHEEDRNGWCSATSISADDLMEMHLADLEHNETLTEGFDSFHPFNPIVPAVDRHPSNLHLPPDQFHKSLVLSCGNDSQTLYNEGHCSNSCKGISLQHRETLRRDRSFTGSKKALSSQMSKVRLRYYTCAMRPINQ